MSGKPSESFNLLRHCLKLYVFGGKRSYLRFVIWYFEPSQPQRITSGLKTMFNPSPIYSTRKSSNHKLSKNHKISPDTKPHKKYTNTKHTFFEELIAPVKKAPKAGTCWYHGPFHRFVNISFFLKYKKGIDRSNNFLYI